MHTLDTFSLDNSADRNKSLRLAGTVIIGSVITFSLFAMMAKLIEQDGRPPEPEAYVTLGPLVLAIDEPDTIERQKIKPMEKPVEMPKVHPEKPDPVPNDNQNVFGTLTQVPKNDINVSINLSGGQSDMQASLQFRRDPTYPAQAAREGIEGWVKLAFNVSPSGSVEDIVVVDATPKNIFNKAARRALSKWKYKPKMEGGKPVQQSGMVVVLEFALAD
jgi:protein TonB